MDMGAIHSISQERADALLGTALALAPGTPPSTLLLPLPPGTTEVASTQRLFKGSI